MFMRVCTSVIFVVMQYLIPLTKRQHETEEQERFFSLIPA